MIDFELEEAQEINQLDPVQFRKAELAWAKKQIEYAKFERKQRRQHNDLVWIVANSKTQFLVTQKGQLRYNKDKDLFKSPKSALDEANRRLAERLLLEDAKDANNKWKREVLWRDSLDDNMPADKVEKLLSKSN